MITTDTIQEEKFFKRKILTTGSQNQSLTSRFYHYRKYF